MRVHEAVSIGSYICLTRDPVIWLRRYGQTEPPTIPVDELFEDGHFPEGEILEHPRDFNTFRVRSVHGSPEIVRCIQHGSYSEKGRT